MAHGLKRIFIQKSPTTGWRQLKTPLLQPPKVQLHGRKGMRFGRLIFRPALSRKSGNLTTNQLEGFTYSRETGEYHLICSDETGWLFVDLDPQGSVLDMTRDKKQERYAYLKDEAGTNVFYIKARADSQPTRVVWPGAVEDHRGPIGDYISNGKYLYGDYLFFTGDLPGQPVGLWQYNTQNGISHCLASGLKHPLAYASVVLPQSGAITNALGKQMSYHIWEPVKVDAGKKYPLIITQTTYGPNNLTYCRPRRILFCDGCPPLLERQNDL